MSLLLLAWERIRNLITEPLQPMLPLLLQQATLAKCVEEIIQIPKYQTVRVLPELRSDKRSSAVAQGAPIQRTAQQHLCACHSRRHMATLELRLSLVTLVLLSLAIGSLLLVVLLLDELAHCQRRAAALTGH